MTERADRIISILAWLFILCQIVFFWAIESVLLNALWNIFSGVLHTSHISFVQAGCVNALLFMFKEFWGGGSMKQFAVFAQSDHDREHIEMMEQGAGNE